MPLVEQINQDLKQALLARDKELVSILRGIKSAILYEEVAQNKRESGLSDSEAGAVLRKEAKKRHESAELYRQGGDEERAAKESAEAEVIQKYLPSMMTDDEVAALVDQVLQDNPGADTAKLGVIISEVKERSEGRAEGAVIAKLVKEKLA